MTCRLDDTPWTQNEILKKKKENSNKKTKKKTKKTCLQKRSYQKAPSKNHSNYTIQYAKATET